MLTHVVSCQLTLVQITVVVIFLAICQLSVKVAMN